MRFRDVALSEVTASEVEAWQDLAANAIEPNAFVDPNFLLPSAATHYMARDARVMLVEDGSDLIAVAAHRPGKLGIRRLSVRTWTTADTFSAFEGERFHPLVAAARPEAAVEGLLVGSTRAVGADIVELVRTPVGAGLAEAVEAVAGELKMPLTVTTEQEAAYGVRPHAPMAGFLATDHRSSRTRKSYRRLLQRIEEDAGGTATITDSGGDPDAIRRFLDLQVQGWKGDRAKDGKAFRLTGLDRWFAAVAEAFRDAGKLAVLELSANGHIVYTSVALKSGRGMFGFHDAYAERFASLSPGSIGRLAELRVAFDDPCVQFYDPSMDAKYAASALLYPDRKLHRSYRIAVSPAGHLGQLVLPGMTTAAHGLKSRLKAVWRPAAKGS